MTKAECINHPGRFAEIAQCSSHLRDFGPVEGTNQICACCDECRAKCLTIPHGHGGTPKEEWGRKYCKICGEDITRWKKK